MEGKDNNSNVSKDKIRILMFGRIRWEFQCLEGWDKNSNVSKDQIRILKSGIKR